MKEKKRNRRGKRWRKEGDAWELYMGMGSTT